MQFTDQTQQKSDRRRQGRKLKGKKGQSFSYIGKQYRDNQKASQDTTQRNTTKHSKSHNINRRENRKAGKKREGPELPEACFFWTGRLQMPSEITPQARHKRPSDAYLKGGSGPLIGTGGRPIVKRISRQDRTGTGRGGTGRFWRRIAGRIESTFKIAPIFNLPYGGP